MTQIKRSAGQSAVAAAAYRAGEKLHSEYYGEDSDYTRKGGVICSEILLPSHAPPEYADRETLWNAVEKAVRGRMPDAFRETYRKICTEFFPQSGYEYGNGVEIEVYPSADVQNPDYTCEIWIAVKPKK